MIVIIVGRESGPWGANVAVGGSLLEYRHEFSTEVAPQFYWKAQSILISPAVNAQFDVESSGS